MAEKDKAKDELKAPLNAPELDEINTAQPIKVAWLAGSQHGGYGLCVAQAYGGRIVNGLE